MTRRAEQRRAVARLGILGLAIAVAFAVVANAGIGPNDAQRAIADAGLLAPVLFVLAAGVLGLALFPGHLIAATSGLLFGALAGTALALAAALIGAGLCLYAARHLGADALASLLGPPARRHRAWLTANGFSAVLASRLAPGLPAGPVNYLAGLAGIRRRAFFAAVALGALPKTIAYVALGWRALGPAVSTRRGRGHAVCHRRRGWRVGRSSTRSLTTHAGCMLSQATATQAAMCPPTGACASTAAARVDISVSCPPAPQASVGPKRSGIISRVERPTPERVDA